MITSVTEHMQNTGLLERVEEGTGMEETEGVDLTAEASAL